MNNRSVFVALIPLVLTACDPAFWDGGSVDISDVFNGGAHDPPDSNDPPGPPGTGGAGGGGGGDSGPLSAAVAMTRAQREALMQAYYDQIMNETGSVVSTAAAGGQPDQDPNDLMLHISDMGESCDVYPRSLPCGEHWQLRLVLPIAYQQVGVYDLDDFALHATVFETGAPYSPAPDDCPMGGGTLFGSGTLEILAIDSAEVRFRVTTDAALMGGNPSGEYTAPRCP
ncbi:hypothetical protein [Sorangium sp. So ce394]|uniref:hypothetical protein n=1 Tax=Sorangium sp. So ce394 TaxID=3133310 RepID=UPI003F5C5AD6